jgi:hypothetical protein
MSLIDASVASRLARYRLIEVLKAEMPAEIALLNDTNNTITLPDDQSYFVTATELEMNAILNSQNAGCFVFQLGPSTFTAARTGDGNKRARLEQTVFRVVYLFRSPAGWETYTADGDRPVNKTELVWHLADRIMGAALEVIYKHAVNTTDVHSVEVVSQTSDVVTVNNNDLMGRAVLEIQVLQDVLVPMPAYTIP